MKNVIIWIHLKTPLAIVLFFAFTQLAFAEKDSGSVNLGTVTVTGEEKTSGTRDADIISGNAIDRARISRTVDGLFGDIAGIDLKRTSLGGNTGSEVSLRGFGESRYIVMLDGRPVNGSGVYGGEYVDWSCLSTDDIERVEVIRGATSAEYGNTLGGIISIITKKGTEKMKIKIRSSYGSFNTTAAAVSHSGNLGHFLYDNLSYGYWRTDGYLRNNYVNRDNFSGRLNFLLPQGLNASLGARYTVQERGFVVENRKEKSNYKSRYPESDEDAGGGPYIQWFGKPGPFGPINPVKYWGGGSHWVDERGQYDVELKKSFDSLNIKARGYLNRQKRTEYYYAINDSGNLVLKRCSEPDKSGGWLLKASLPAGKHDIGYGLEGVYLGYGGQEIKHADGSYFRIQPSSLDAPKRMTRRHAVFAQGAWNITDYLELDAGLRYDNYWAKEYDIVYEQGLSPKFGVKYEIWKGLKLEADFGQAYRFPAPPESYWFYAGYDPPDRKRLSPERALQAEIGIYNEFSDEGKIGVRGYYYDVRDYIRTIFGYKPSRVVYNIDKVTLWGVEVEGQYALAKGLYLFANYTFQTTKKKGDVLDMSSNLTDSLTELPKNKINAGSKYSFRGFMTEFVMRYVDKRSVITGDLAESGASELADMKRFATFDLNFSYKVLEKDNIAGTVDLNIENLFDAGYEETKGFPMPGRTIVGGVNITF